MAPAGGDIQRKRDWIKPRRGMAQAVIRIPHGGNRAEQKKGKGARNEKSLAPIIKQNDGRGKRMAKQKDGRYRAKITVGTGAI